MVALSIYFMLIVTQVDALESSQHKVTLTTPTSRESVTVHSQDPVSIRLKAEPSDNVIRIVHVNHSPKITSSSEEKIKNKKTKLHLVSTHESSESDSYIKKKDISDSSSSLDNKIYLKKKRNMKRKKNLLLTFPKTHKHKIIIAKKKNKPTKKMSISYKKKKLNLNQDSDSSSSSSSLSSTPSLSSTSTTESNEHSSSSSSSQSDNTVGSIPKQKKQYILSLNKKHMMAKGKLRKIHKNKILSASSSLSSSSTSSSSLLSSSSSEHKNSKKTLEKTILAQNNYFKLNKKTKPIHGFIHYQTNNNGNVKNGHYATLKRPLQDGTTTLYNIQHNVYGRGGKTNQNPTSLVEDELEKLRQEYPWLKL